MKDRGLDALVNDCLVRASFFPTPQFLTKLPAGGPHSYHGCHLRRLPLRATGISVPAIHKSAVQHGGTIHRRSPGVLVPSRLADREYFLGSD
jgi:hypothetical protein